MTCTIISSRRGNSLAAGITTALCIDLYSASNPLRAPPHAPLLTLATAAIALTAIVAPRPLHAEPPTSPCALLTPLQIKAVLNTPVLNGQPGAPSDDTIDCTWADTKGETRLYVSLKDPGISYKSFRDTMLATGRLLPGSGLSADAF